MKIFKRIRWFFYERQARGLAEVELQHYTRSSGFKVLKNRCTTTPSSCNKKELEDALETVYREAYRDWLVRFQHEQDVSSLVRDAIKRGRAIR